jgi:hypothetical protein
MINVNVLVNISFYKFEAVRIVLVCHELVSVPCKVNVEGRDEERCRGGRHEVQEPTSSQEGLWKPMVMRHRKRRTHDNERWHAVMRAHLPCCQRTSVPSNEGHASSSQMILGGVPGLDDWEFGNKPIVKKSLTAPTNSTEKILSSLYALIILPILIARTIHEHQSPPS